MKRLHFHSFRQRLNAAFLAVSLAPLLLCSVLLLQIFRFRMTADQQQNAQQQLSSACHALNTMQDGILSAAENLQRDGLVTRALAGAQEDSAKVYSSLYTATAAVRSTARFDLYSADGTLLYSTQAAPGEDALSPDWGILYEAAQAENGTLVYSASEDPTDPDAPVLRAAARLTVSGKTAGFLVAVMYGTAAARGARRYGGRAERAACDGPLLARHLLYQAGAGPDAGQRAAVAASGREGADRIFRRLSLYRPAGTA